jgi:acyl-coenzyme A synthetase/AMP-(fatty) acid ligase
MAAQTTANPLQTLPELVIHSAGRDPAGPAVHGPDGALSYGQLSEQAGAYAAALRARGVREGDRVVLWSHKNTQVVALMQGCLRLGAVYVPVSAANPPSRLARIVTSAGPALVVADADSAARVQPGEWSLCPIATIDELRDDGSGVPVPPLHPARPGDLAYILYTSGSTGEPKGVCLSHRNALAFVQWAAAELGLTAADRLSSHAPFNFDLSVFDLYGAFLAGACVHLIPEEMAYAPGQLVTFLREQRISVWYSVPSALSLMMRQGGLLDGAAPPDLRACVFAGEPFPIRQVATLRKAWPGVRLLNWYGPTETNVCTSYEVTDADLSRQRPLPIGRPASGDQLELAGAGPGAEGQRSESPGAEGPGAEGPGAEGEAGAGEGGEGELVVSGPTVMLGYWGREPHSGPYHTGDLARWNDDGDLEYLGRSDHMVKLRGHRIELGEVESAVSSHEAVEECVALVTGSGLEARLHAVVVPRGERGPSLLAVKRLCSERLPTYMIVDAVHTVTELPLTGNGKTDRAALAQRIEG